MTPIKTEKLDFKESAIKMRREAEINQLKKENENAKKTLKNQNEKIEKGNKKLESIKKDYDKLKRKLKEVKSQNLGSVFGFIASIIGVPFIVCLSLFAANEFAEDFD